jgi:hypothetical protein
LPPPHTPDDLGINQIQALGAAFGFTGENGTIRTPNLIALAQQGILFQNAYATFDVRCSIALPPSSPADRHFTGCCDTSFRFAARPVPAS